MDPSRRRPSIWSRFRSRHSFDSSNLQDDRLRPILHMDIWNLLDEFSGATHGEHPRLAGSMANDMQVLIENDMNDEMRSTRITETRMRPPQRIDTLSVLQNCQKVVYKAKSMPWGKGKFESEQTECSVCLEKFVSKDKLFLLPCNHLFHIKCLTPWIKSNHGCCPFCRADILGGLKKTEKKSSLASFCSRGSHRRNMSGNLSSYRPDSDDAWEGLQEYIMTALAEVDNELNRLMR